MKYTETINTKKGTGKLDAYTDVHIDTYITHSQVVVSHLLIIHVHVTFIMARMKRQSQKILSFPEL